MQTVVLSVGVINCVVLCIIDTYNKAKLKQTTEIDKYNGYLNKWSLLTMITCTIRLLLYMFYTIPTLCQYFEPQYFPPLPLMQIFFTFYQIGRFHHCFISFHSKYIFVLLYINGVLLIIIFYYLQIIGMHQELNHKQQCIRIINKSIERITSIALAWYLIWDIIVLVMYGVKLNSIKTSITNNPKQYRKVAQFLSKMLTLTIGMEVILWVIIIVFFGMQISDNQFYMQLFGVIYVCITCITIFLMAEHNSKIYESFIKFLSQTIFCTSCCCCCIRTVPEPTQIEPDMEFDANANHKNSVLTKIAMTEVHDACNKHEINDVISHSKTEGEYKIDSILLKPKQYELLQIYKASQSQFLSDCIQLGLSEPDIEIITSHFENMKRIPTIDIKPQSQIEGL